MAQSAVGFGLVPQIKSLRGGVDRRWVSARGANTDVGQRKWYKSLHVLNSGRGPPPLKCANQNQQPGRRRVLPHEGTPLQKEEQRPDAKEQGDEAPPADLPPPYVGQYPGGSPPYSQGGYSYTAYPHQQPGGYIPPYYSQGGYLPQQDGGYPPQQPAGYPLYSQGGYPPQQSGGYLPYNQSGYPPYGQGGYPPQQFGGYLYPPYGQGWYRPYGYPYPPYGFPYPPYGQGGYSGYPQQPHPPPPRQSPAMADWVAGSTIAANAGKIFEYINNGSDGMTGDFANGF